MKLFLKLHWTLLLLSNYLPSFIHKRRQWQPTPVLLPAKSHGWRSLVGCSPWGLEEPDRTKCLRFHFSLTCIGGGNSNPVQYFCLESPRNREAWWVAVYRVTQSWTRLKWFSTSSIHKNTLSVVIFFIPLYLLTQYQSSSVTHLCPTLCNPVDCSTPGFPIHYQLLKLVQTLIYRVGDVIQPSHSLLSTSPPAFNLSQIQGLFEWVSSLH